MLRCIFDVLYFVALRSSLRKRRREEARRLWTASEVETLAIVVNCAAGGNVMRLLTIVGSAELENSVVLGEVPYSLVESLGWEGRKGEAGGFLMGGGREG